VDDKCEIHAIINPQIILRQLFVTICLETGVLCGRPPQEIAQAISENLQEQTKFKTKGFILIV
jgi:hypothetical protein